MKLADYKYDLPDELIAQYPSERRDGSRLMILNRKTGEIENNHFADIVDYFNDGDVLVINETKVFPARLYGFKEKTNAKVELLLLRQLEETMWEALVKPARKVRIGNRLIIANEIACDVIDNTISGGRVIKFDYNGNDFFDLINRIGDSPLPPYINRSVEPLDKERYQTVYAKKTGAVAAPTAGLHFTPEILDNIVAKGVRLAPIILHVGLGTFKPVQAEDLSRHQMDSEYYEISEKSSEIINTAKKNGNRIIAVGTTSVRTLETVATPDGLIKKNSGWTDKFIYPPYQFKVVDGIITNFHLPRSTLFILVSTFTKHEFIQSAYTEAVDNRYRFYSYGDAMMIV